MNSSHVLDAHAVIWFLQEDERLGPAARAILQDPKSQFLFPSITYAEACLAIERGRTKVPSVDVFAALISADKRFRITPLTARVVAESLQLTVLNDLHDRFLVATARIEIARGRHCSVLTADAAIVESGLVEISW